MNHRDALLAAITDMVIDRDAEGSVIDVDDAASRLLREHPNSGMTFDGIVAHIETMGVIVGATLLAGNQSDRNAA